MRKRGSLCFGELCELKNLRTDRIVKYIIILAMTTWQVLSYDKTDNVAYRIFEWRTDVIDSFVHNLLFTFPNLCFIFKIVLGFNSNVLRTVVIFSITFSTQSNANSEIMVKKKGGLYLTQLLFVMEL